MLTKISLPKGFDELVNLILKDDPILKGSVPKKTGEIWDDFVYCVFIDENRSDADVRYLYDLLDAWQLLDMAVVLKLRGKWKEKAEKVCSSEMCKVSGRKHGVLSGFLISQNLWDTTQCLVDLADYFVKKNICRDVLLKRTVAVPGLNDLIAEIAYPNSPEHIRNIGLTKTILWLHALGLASEHCPPSRQSRAFLYEDVEGLSGPIPYVEWDNYWPWLKKVENVAKHLSVTVRDISKAAWYYKSSQSLLAQFRAGLKWKFTPGILVKYVDENYKNLLKYADALTDIDEVDNLRGDLRAFVEAVH